MNLLSHSFTKRVTGTAAVALLFATGSVMSLPVLAAKQSPLNHVESRITELRGQIGVTPAQEEQWSKVTEVMRENAKALSSLTEARLENAKRMSAVDDLKSYSQIATAHAEGAQKLVPVFEAFYANLSDAQKKKADESFRHGHGLRHHHSSSGSL